MSRPTREMAVGLCPALSPPHSHSHYTSNGRLRQFQSLRSPVVILFYTSFVHFARTGHPRSLSSSQHIFSCSLADLPFQIIMSVRVPGKHRLRVCSCGCNRPVTRWTERRHKNSPLIVQPESPPPPKRRRVAHVQADQEFSIITPGKQKQSRTDNNSPASHSRADASSSSSDQSQLRAPSFEFNPSLPLLDLPGAARTEVSGLPVDDIPLDLHARTHRTIDQSDDEDSEDSLEGDTVEATDSADDETDDFRSKEDVDMEGDLDPREGIVSDWDLLAEKFIVEAEELGKFEHSLLHMP